MTTGPGNSGGQIKKKILQTFMGKLVSLYDAMICNVKALIFSSPGGAP